MAYNHVIYDTEYLRSLRSVPVTSQTWLSTETFQHIRELGISRRHRGRRGGVRLRACRPPILQQLPCGAWVIVGSRRPAPRRDVVYDRPRCLVPVPIQRHAVVPSRDVIFSSINIRSLSAKFDAVLEEFRDRRFDLLMLQETWHDTDDVTIRRLRTEGYSVIERARPRSRRAEASLGVNHGGVAIVAASGLRLARVDVGVVPTTFECVAARVTSGTSTYVVVVIYRPGGPAPTANYYVELADVLDRVSTLADPLVIVGDVNIRLERSSTPDAIQFNDLLAGYGLHQRVVGATHNEGGTLDVVCTRSDLPAPSVEVLDVDLSDHRLLRWVCPFQRPSPAYTTVTRRCWGSFDSDVFRADLLASALCDEDQYKDLNGHSLAVLYDTTISQLLDRQVPIRTYTCRRRPSSQWFDVECRRAKRAMRSLEWSVRRAGSSTPASPSTVAAWRAQRRFYFDLVDQKRSAYWTDRVNVDQSHPRRLWQSFDELLGRQRQPATDVDASRLHRFFEEKVAAVRTATADADPPTFTPAPVGCVFETFAAVSPADVVKYVTSLPDKQCASDPLPTWLLKKNVDILAPFLCRLTNWSLEHGVVPSTFKTAYITPILKKSDLDSANAASYRPISNLSVLSKLLERFVAKQLVDFLKDKGLLPDLQSAYKAHHSTETAILNVLADILLALDSGELAILTLLDLSAAFDSVDHETLLQRLQTSYGLSGDVITWFASYLTGRTQYVRCSTTTSTPSAMLYGVPQGSVLGPILFLLYTADLLQLIKRHQLHPHLYADDTQIYGHCQPSSVDELQEAVSVCVDDVQSWMRANRLQLNPSKTEVLWCSSSRRQHQIPTRSVRIGDTFVSPVSSVRDLGVYLDADLAMRIHVTATVRTCFAALRQIRIVRRSIPRHTLLTLIRALVISKVDYCNSVLAGISGQLLSRLQSVLNAAARLVFSARRFEHISPLLRELHWLRVPERIQFRLCVLTYRSLHGSAPTYLTERLQLVSDVAGRRCLRSADSDTLVVPPTRRTTLGDRAFPVAASKAWNSLPPSIRASPSLPCFRRDLKTFLFSSS